MVWLGMVWYMCFWGLLFVCSPVSRCSPTFHAATVCVCIGSVPHVCVCAGALLSRFCGFWAKRSTAK